MDKIAALYIRLSVEDSKVESMSIQNQRLALHKFADSLDELDGFEIQEFVDNGYSGTNFERPAVQELLDGVRQGKIHCILVKDFSRFGRDSLEVGYFMEKVFPLYGVRFISLNDEFDSAKLHRDTGGINVAFKYLISEFYSRDLSVKYKSAKHVKFKRGEYQSKICPYGYQKSADGRMEPDPETAAHVRLIFEMAAQGYSMRGIAAALFERGISTPGEYKASQGFTAHDISRTNGVWQTGTLTRILDDERYTGTYIMGKTEIVKAGGRQARKKEESQWIKIPNHHPAIVSKEEFQAAQAKRRHFKCPKKNRRVYLLRSKIFCGLCHHALSRSKTKEPYFYCRQGGSIPVSPCHKLSITESDLHGLLYEILSKQAQAILNKPDLYAPDLVNPWLAQQAGYDKQLGVIQQRKRLLFEQMVLGGISEEGYKEQREALGQEAARLQQLHDALEAQIEQSRLDEQAKDIKTKLAQKVAHDGELSAELVDALIERVYVYPENQVKIVWKMSDFAFESTEFQKC